MKQSQHVLEMDPSFTGAYLMLGRGYELQGKWQDAIAAFEHGKGQYRRGYLAGMAYVWAASGNRSQAQAALTDLTKFSRHNYISPIDFATYYAASGNSDKAFEWLDTAYQRHATGMIALDVNNRLDNLRSDPRFKELERRAGF